MRGSQIVALESSAGISGEVTVPVREQRSGSLASFQRRGAVVARQAHNLKVVGSSPTAATKSSRRQQYCTQGSDMTALYATPEAGIGLRKNATPNYPEGVTAGETAQDTTLTSSGRAVGQKSQVRCAPLRVDANRGLDLGTGSTVAARRAETSLRSTICGGLPLIGVHGREQGEARRPIEGPRGRNVTLLDASSAALRLAISEPQQGERDRRMADAQATLDLRRVA
jgi:hypothetical protein